MCVCLSVCFGQHTQTVSCTPWFQLICSLCECRVDLQGNGVHLKDLSERRSTQRLLCFLSSPPKTIQIWAASRTLETSWNIADTGSRMRSTRTRLRVFLEGDKFQAWEKCWGSCCSWWVDALFVHTGKHTLLLHAPTYTYTKTSHTLAQTVCIDKHMVI